MEKKKKIREGDEALQFPRYEKEKGTHSRVVSPAVLDKYRKEHPKCEVKFCRLHRSSVHHIKYRSHGGPDSPENLIALCWSHDKHAHGMYAKQWARRFRNVKEDK